MSFGSQRRGVEGSHRIDRWSFESRGENADWGWEGAG
jgi:hypothetical protein